MKGLVVVAFATLFLSACKTTTEPTYYYGSYQEVVYSYFKADELPVAEQINILEEVVEQARGMGKPVPPGMHAHLGLLYFEVGNSDLGRSHFEKEKALFPESTQYMNFLLSNSQGASI